jgi:hypothetical protein
MKCSRNMVCCIVYSLINGLDNTPLINELKEVNKKYEVVIKYIEDYDDGSYLKELCHKNITNSNIDIFKYLFKDDIETITYLKLLLS